MPIFATLVAGAINGLIGVFSWFMAYNQAIAWARRAFIIALGAAFMLAVGACISVLKGLFSTALLGLPARVLMGIGMFIPSNAAVVLSCMGAVWLAAVLYRLKLEGLRW